MTPCLKLLMVELFKWFLHGLELLNWALLKISLFFYEKQAYLTCLTCGLPQILLIAQIRQDFPAELNSYHLKMFITDFGAQRIAVLPNSPANTPNTSPRLFVQVPESGGMEN